MISGSFAPPTHQEFATLTRKNLTKNRGKWNYHHRSPVTSLVHCYCVKRFCSAKKSHKKPPNKQSPRGRNSANSLEAPIAFFVWSARKKRAGKRCKFPTHFEGHGQRVNLAYGRRRRELCGFSFSSAKNDSGKPLKNRTRGRMKTQFFCVFWQFTFLAMRTRKKWRWWWQKKKFTQINWAYGGIE